MRRPAVAAAVITLALALAAGPALATAPQRFEFDFQEADTIDCSAFDPAWAFHDDFVDSFHDRAQVWFDADGNPVRAIEHIQHTSNDVNSVTGFTLHEHNHFTSVTDFVEDTLTISGAINVMQRKGVGELIQNTGHKVIDLTTGYSNKAEALKAVGLAE